MCFPMLYSIFTLVSTNLRIILLCLVLVNTECLSCIKCYAMLGVREGVKINRSLAFKGIYRYICMYTYRYIYTYKCLVYIHLHHIQHLKFHMAQSLCEITYKETAASTGSEENLNLGYALEEF